jgi:CHAT domain-containing protein
MNLRKCQLVYLSACESSLSKDIRLRNEGIHVAGAFHMAGVPHVISTLWPISDKVSVEVASLFYKFLKEENDGVVDVGCSAVALHSSVQKLRESGVSAILWGPYIHSGP